MGLDDKGPSSIIPSEVRFLRLLWCNGAGLRATRVVPLSDDDDVRKGQLEAVQRQALSVGLTEACMCLPSWGDVPAQGSGYGPIGDITVVADPSTLRQLPWHPTHAVAQVNMLTDEGGVWELDPRGVLRRVLALAEERAGITIRAGFELEFVIADKDGEPVDRRTYCSSSAYDAMAVVLDHMCQALAKLGIGVEQVHAEAGPGQFELALCHAPCLNACDSLLLAKETVVAVARLHNLRASFLPKYRPNEAGNGQHVHLSVWAGDSNLARVEKGANGAWGPLLPRYSNFLAGVLARLPGIMVLSSPTPNSFRRLAPGAWAGAFWIWGVGNKEAPLRLPARQGKSNNFEFKMMDGTANPHYTLAAIVAAGLLGLEGEEQLPPPVQVDPGTLSPSELETAGIRPLPRCFSAAKDFLMSDKCRPLRELLGEPLVQCAVAVRESEWSKLEGLSLEDEVALLFDRV